MEWACSLRFVHMPSIDFTPNKQTRPLSVLYGDPHHPLSLIRSRTIHRLARHSTRITMIIHHTDHVRAYYDYHSGARHDHGDLYNDPICCLRRMNTTVLFFTTLLSAASRGMQLLSSKDPSVASFSLILQCSQLADRYRSREQGYFAHVYETISSSFSHNRCSSWCLR